MQFFRGVHGVFTQPDHLGRRSIRRGSARVTTGGAKITMPRPRRALTASLAAVALMLVPAAAAQADSATVERTPWDETFGNPCNGDTVTVKATVVVSTKITATADKLAVDQRASFENISTQSQKGLAYKVTRTISDAFRMTVKRNQQKLRSSHTEVLRLKPANGTAGDLRVTVRAGFEIDLATGATRKISYSTTVSCT
jgi:hypothetical protein